VSTNINGGRTKREVGGVSLFVAKEENQATLFVGYSKLVQKKQSGGKGKEGAPFRIRKQ